jgi:hypothetical protein
LVASKSSMWWHSSSSSFKKRKKQPHSQRYDRSALPLALSLYLSVFCECFPAYQNAIFGGCGAWRTKLGSYATAQDSAHHGPSALWARACNS